MKLSVTVLRDPDYLLVVRSVKQVKVLSHYLLLLGIFLKFGDESDEMNALFQVG